jgi:hypothetical protein
MQLLPVLSLFVLIPTGWASLGDQLDEFEQCIDACEFIVCHTRTTSQGNRFLKVSFEDTPPLLKLLVWDCSANCDYQCQQIVTQLRTNEGEEVLQFHGKWPFKRLFGTQELASAIFSMLNFHPHYYNFHKSTKLYNEAFGSFKVLYGNIVLMSAVTMCAWIFSTIFHIRDLLVTERLDYFFAGATVLSGFHGLLIRVFRLDRDPTKRKWASITCALMYLFHFIRLNYDWSYTYNMQANIFVALLQYLLLLKLGYDHYQRDPKGTLWTKPPLLILTVVLAMTFEVFDFFNIRFQLDAHAMWHLFTVLPGYWLYDFLYADINTLRDHYTD